MKRTKKTEQKQWFYIVYDTKTANLIAYFEMTYSDFMKKLDKFKARYSNVEWSYCDNPYK